MEVLPQLGEGLCLFRDGRFQAFILIFKPGERGIEFAGVDRGNRGG